MTRMPGRLQSERVADFSQKRRPTSPECALSAHHAVELILALQDFLENRMYSIFTDLHFGVRNTTHGATHASHPITRCTSGCSAAGERERYEWQNQQRQTIRGGCSLPPSYWVLAVLWPRTACALDAIEGPTRVIDGDTIESDEERIRLWGISAGSADRHHARLHDRSAPESRRPASDVMGHFQQVRY